MVFLIFVYSITALIIIKRILDSKFKTNEKQIEKNRIMITVHDIDITKLQWQAMDKCYTYTYPDNKVATIQEYGQDFGKVLTLKLGLYNSVFMQHGLGIDITKPLYMLSITIDTSNAELSQVRKDCLVDLYNKYHETYRVL